MRWVSTVTTCSLEIVLPAAIGYWIDHKLGTVPWFAVGGLVLGLVAGPYHFYVAMKAEMDKTKRGK